MNQYDRLFAERFTSQWMQRQHQARRHETRELERIAVDASEAEYRMNAIRSHNKIIAQCDGHEYKNAMTELVKTCNKVPYTKVKAKEQVRVRERDKGRPGRFYYCREHSAWHVTKRLHTVPDFLWKKIARERKTKGWG